MVTNSHRPGTSREAADAVRRPFHLHPERLFPAEPNVRAIAKDLFVEVERLPIVSPHGHCDARWWADDEPFTDPASLLVTGDHYLLRMLYSHGVPLESLGVQPGGRVRTDTDPDAAAPPSRRPGSFAPSR